MYSRLKSLELHGFKTFAGKTNFQFPGLITAVVGPNGSGKSNIADALRWVLGEQSFMLLRGRKTEDMIFGGSEHRPKAGMASATITFDNQDGWLPIDFSEVSITRRAYRDGQNEYFLNGQRVRLREIAELLAQSGLAERTYTFIGQGLVDAALSLKPEERRRFFEEAAGIGLYRSRREEALDRLENTKRNLERVRDILSELEPRLQSLEKQAKRVIEYERIKADLHLLLRDWYGYHWHRIQQEVTHSKDVQRAQEDRVQQAREKLSTVEHEVGQLRVKVQEQRQQLNSWHNKSAELHQQWEKVSRELAVMDERKRAQVEQRQNSETDLARLEEEEKARLERRQLLVQEGERLRQTLKEASVEVEQARRNLEARQAERAEAERALRESRKQQVNYETRQVQIKARQNELISRLEGLERNLRNVQQAVSNETQALQKAAARREEEAQLVDEAKYDVKKAEEGLQTGRKKMGDLENTRRQYNEERSKLEAERMRQRAQLDVLEQAEKSFSGLNQGARFVLQAANQGRLSGRFQVISSLLEVPAGYEAALAAVLGEMLDAVIAGDDDGLERALKLLEQGEKGRAVLFPTQLNNAGTPKFNTPADNECLGRAIDLVKTPAEWQPLFELLLGQVLVVKNREAARRLLPGLPASARVVTLQGEVFWPSGMVQAGQDGRSGMVGRTRQRRELQDLLDQSEVKVKEISQKVQEVEAEIVKQRAAEQELDKKLRAANQRASQANQSFQQASLAFEQTRQKQEWQRNQSTQLEKQIQQTNEEIERGKADLTAVEKKISEMADITRQQNRVINGLPLDELQNQLVHWNTRGAVAAQAVKDADHRLQEFDSMISAEQGRRQALLRRIQSINDGLAQLEQEKQTKHVLENELNTQLEALRQMIEPVEISLAELEEVYSHAQLNQTTAQQAVSVAERYYAQAQSELSRNREALESLRRRIEEDFGLVAFEYKEDISGPAPLPLEGVESLPVLKEISPEIEENITRQRSALRRLGAVNLEAHREYSEVKERFDFLSGQMEDLKKADIDLRQVITELDELMRREFRKTFDAVAAEFKQMFTRLFGGGSARLVLSNDEVPTEAGIDIEARLPGRREQGLSLLSGGERSLTAVALIFALIKVSPTPFCGLDEVDAMLDEANVGRFCELLRELSEKTQFVVITHNRNTVQVADVIYGVTMGRDSASQVISLRLDEVNEEMVR
jgi:chromosome segregation protein